MTVKHYETVLVFTPVLSEADVKKKISDYLAILRDKGMEIVEEDFWGIKQLAYPIKKKTSGIYFVTEFKGENAKAIQDIEILFLRDTDILRFLTVSLDKYAIKYNSDKRAGLVGRNKKNANKPLPKSTEAAQDGKDEATTTDTEVDVLDIQE
ncbi:MAG: 30S ribosomal protein S6 [Chitinophagales bacterium]|nr:30S ribosomal protein S6 [Bacteroidota bacterium]MCB9042549.1 30S ribosomal protein S6 [Chitinophagales bacterium]